jgi:hypothetical protein
MNSSFVWAIQSEKNHLALTTNHYLIMGIVIGESSHQTIEVGQVTDLETFDFGFLQRLSQTCSP